MALLDVSVALSMIIASAAAAAQPNAAAKKPATPDTAVKYCIETEPFTGSKLTKTECKTKAEWAKQGVDVDQLVKH
jgi:hypothetical protein